MHLVSIKKTGHRAKAQCRLEYLLQKQQHLQEWPCKCDQSLVVYMEWTYSMDCFRQTGKKSNSCTPQ